MISILWLKATGHGRYPKPSAWGGPLNPYNPYWLEDPLGLHQGDICLEDTAALAQVTAAVDVPVAAGETFSTKYGFRRIVSAVCCFRFPIFFAHPQMVSKSENRHLWGKSRHCCGLTSLILQPFSSRNRQAPFSFSIKDRACRSLVRIVKRDVNSKMSIPR